MPEPTKIPRPFADSGDKNSIPESSGSLGFASWQEGFPAITGTPFAQGGVAPKRADFNGIFNALSLAILWQQQGGFYAYDNTTDYEVGNVVLYSGDLYKCITANGPSSAVKAPTDTTVWGKVMTSTDVAALYLPLSTISTGTWTPGLIGSSDSGELIIISTGIYVRIGSFVYIQGLLSVKAKSGYANYPSGFLDVTGLPYVAKTPQSIIPVYADGGVDTCCRILSNGYINNNTIRLIVKLSNAKSYFAQFISSTPNNQFIAFDTATNSNIYLSGGYMTDDV